LKAGGGVIKKRRKSEEEPQIKKGLSERERSYLPGSPQLTKRKKQVLCGQKGTSTKDPEGKALTASLFKGGSKKGIPKTTGRTGKRLEIPVKIKTKVRRGEETTSRSRTKSVKGGSLKAGHYRARPGSRSHESATDAS